MANQELYGNSYQVPAEILKYIHSVLMANPKAEGVKRAKFLIKNGSITYQAMKRLKNFFDYFNPNTDDKVQYALAGGDIMRSFVERTLSGNRDAVSRSKDVKRDMTVNPNSELKAYQTPKLSENVNKKELNKNAVALIVNNDNKFLLAKRGEKAEWMPNKWALVGGKVEKGETPEQACKREIKEETGLDISNFINSFSLQRNSGSIEHMFACRYEGEPTDIVLNKENSNYGWFDVSEITFLDTVPHLMEYITLAFKKYE